MNHPELCYATILACALLHPGSAASEGDSPDNAMDLLERQLELGRHGELLARMAMPGSTLAAFTTDGCSGGLSAGWEYLAEHIDTVREQHGVLPAWEHCCVAHDRLYHTGAAIDANAEESFAARKRADQALQACVIATGQTRAAQLSIEYNLSTDSILTLYAAIAELMYRAVRIGGVPCSGLPWRWGYGWPECG